MNVLGAGKLQNAMTWNDTEGFVITCADGKGSYHRPSGPEGSHFLLLNVMVSLVTWLLNNSCLEAASALAKLFLNFE